jgi:hypothetical protein
VKLEMQDLIKETPSWDLGSDRKLLEALERFSGSIREKSLNLLEEVDNLNSDSVDLECKFRNSFNEFLSLADTQFIENVRAAMTIYLFLWYLQEIFYLHQIIAVIHCYVNVLKTSQKVI